MDIKRSGSQPSGKGPAEWFTGTVRIDPLFQAPDPARVSGASVTFEPGAAERIRKFYAEVAIPASSFARAVAFAMSQPDDVDVNEIVFRPTRQEL